jgi:hypothetical protein
MAPVYYRPAEIIGLIGEDSNESRHRARKQTKEISRATEEQGIGGGLRQAANVVMSLGRGAFGEVLRRQVESVGYVLDGENFEYKTLTGRKSVPYKDVTDIISKSGDKFEVKFKDGAVVIKPIAHLVSGRFRVPIGWLRDGMEVPYTMLIDELSSRCGVEIVPA